MTHATGPNDDQFTADIAALLANDGLQNKITGLMAMQGDQLDWYNAGTLRVVWTMLDEIERIILRRRTLRPSTKRLTYDAIAQMTGRPPSSVAQVGNAIPGKIGNLGWSVAHGFAGLPLEIIRALRTHKVDSPNQLPAKINEMVAHYGFGIKRFEAIEAWWSRQPGRTGLRSYLSPGSQKKLGMDPG